MEYGYLHSRVFINNISSFEGIHTKFERTYLIILYDVTSYSIIHITFICSYLRSYLLACMYPRRYEGSN